MRTNPGVLFPRRYRHVIRFGAGTCYIGSNWAWANRNTVGIARLHPIFCSRIPFKRYRGDDTGGYSACSKKGMLLGSPIGVQISQPITNQEDSVFGRLGQRIYPVECQMLRAFFGQTVGGTASTESES